MKQDQIRQVTDIAYEAGETIMRVYASDDFGVEMKQEGGLTTPMTKADKTANDIILKRLAEISDYPIISEEGNDVAKSGSSHLDAALGGQEERASRTNGTVSERQTPADTAMRQESASTSSSAGRQGEAVQEPERFWLVDPLDGTKDFIDRKDTFTVNIALIENGEPVLGVVYVPAMNLMYTGQKGGGAHKTHDSQNKSIHANFKETKPMVMTSRSHKDERTVKMLKSIGEHEEISMGSSLKLCYVAEGKAMLYPRLAPTYLWDTAAADAVVRAAGGKVTDLDGKPLVYEPAKNMKNPFFVAATKNCLDWENLVF